MGIGGVILDILGLEGGVRIDEQKIGGRIFKEFVKRFQQELQQGPRAETPDPSAAVEPVKAVRVVGQAIGEVLSRPFRRKSDEPGESSSDAKD